MSLSRVEFSGRVVVILSLLLLVYGCTHNTSATEFQDNQFRKIIVQKSGIFTQNHLEGNLESTHALKCPNKLLAFNNQYTPADLYPAALDCINQSNNEMAVQVYRLAGLYARFDASRVSDKSAHQGAIVLVMQTFGGLSPQKKQTFNAALDAFKDNRITKQRFCREVKRIGSPNYHPDYMISHGMQALLSAVDGKSHPEGLIEGFDSQGSWNRLLDDYLHC